MHGKKILHKHRTVFSISAMLGDMSTRERRHEKTRQVILSAAKRLLRKKGLDGFSLRGVATACDYSPAGLYEYFKSKEDLLITIAKDIESDLRNALETGGSRDHSDALIELGRRYISFAKSHPEDYLLIFTTFSSGRKKTDDLSPQSSAYMVLFNLVNQLTESEVINVGRNISIDEICYNYWILLHGHVMMQLTHLKDFQADFEQAEIGFLNRFVDSIK